MTLTAAVQASTELLAQVANPAVRALALAGAAALGLAAFRVRATSARLFTWTAVLYAALAMPLLGWMLPPLAIPVPSLLQVSPRPDVRVQTVSSKAQISQTLVAVSTGRGESEVLVTRNAAVKGIPAAGIGEHASSATAGHASRNRVPIVEAATAPAASSLLSYSTGWNRIQWGAVAAAIYLAVALLFFVRFFVGIAFGRRLLRASQRIHEPRVKHRLAALAWSSGLATVPDVGESELISVPVTMGALRSTILLPSNWREWDDAKLDAVKSRMKFPT